MELRFEVLNSSWTADGEEFAGGEHLVEDASDDLVRLAAGAHAAGAIRLDDDSVVADHVEDDEVSLQKLQEAMGEWIPAVRDPHTNAVLEPGRWSGEWHEGNVANTTLGATGVGVAEIGVDVEAGEDQ
jgi:hypothetical protein